MQDNLDLFNQDHLVEKNSLPPLAVVSHGGGQDSTYESLRIFNSDIYRNKNYRDKNLVFVFSDTGNEKHKTYQNVSRQHKMATDRGYEFHVLSEHSGYHTESWKTLLHQMFKNSTLPMPGQKSCTDNLKVKPIYRFLNAYCRSKITGAKLEFNKEEDTGKPWIQKYVELSGEKIEVFIGFSKGEEIRAHKTLMYQSSKGAFNWMRDCIDFKFNLIEDDITREDCIEYFDRSGYGEVVPSNCEICPYQSQAEIAYAYRTNMSSIDLIAELEKKKWEKDISIYGTKKNGAFSRTSGTGLADTLKVANEKYANHTDEELYELVLRHGHAIAHGY
ncbi:hypothetical protein [Halobacteriovorax sp. CON-3]|uniref:hypothetical protein n=1 Tax=Halobacteriovorax sp. CON-3 TaxID=3157710 RepID=UPI00371A0877